MKQIVAQLLGQALKALKAEGKVPHELEVEPSVQRCKDSAHGDYATNLALIIAKACEAPPSQVAQWIVAALPEDPALQKVEIAGPGFINFFVQANFLFDIVAQILKEQGAFGQSEFGKGQKVLIEFVSANPTGPLHVGHGRSAAFGATLANVLTAAGFEVDKEYYVNDAGRQMNILALSVWLRYLSLAGEDFPFPSNGYKGEYVFEIAKLCREKFGDSHVRSVAELSPGLPADEPQGGDKEIYIDACIASAKALLGEAVFQQFHKAALDFVLEDIKEDLNRFGVSYDCWFSEQSLLDNGAIEKGIQALKDGNHTYVKEGALWFKATDFADEKDRVLIRANGQSTYFASDVAYHWNKYERNYDRVIDIFGADHHGYVSRVRAAVTALGHDEKALSILLVQFAILYRGEERVQMSTRSGSFVTLRELQDEVGTDAARFFYLMRKADQHMDFDLDLAKSESSDNPVYYIQYAHARICSVFRQLAERNLSFDEAEGLKNVNLLTEAQELALLGLLTRYPETVVLAANTCEPHHIVYFLRELATAIHSYYNAIQLLCEDVSLRHARLALLKALRQVLKNGLELLGVSAPESM